MAIDLNGSATGLNFATSYREEDAPASIVAANVRVGGGSTSINTATAMA